jgi:hypothetical protein
MTMQQEHEAMKNWLRYNGKHTERCPARKYEGGIAPQYICTCGLHKLLRNKKESA